MDTNKSAGFPSIAVCIRLGKGAMFARRAFKARCFRQGVSRNVCCSNITVVCGETRGLEDAVANLISSLGSPLCLSVQNFCRKGFSLSQKSLKILKSCSKER